MMLPEEGFSLVGVGRGRSVLERHQSEDYSLVGNVVYQAANMEPKYYADSVSICFHLLKLVMLCWHLRRRYYTAQLFYPYESGMRLRQ